MAWQDRIQEAAYTSPSGRRQTFDYEDVRRNVEKKTTGFDFPDADGTYVQDLGATGRKYPLRLFFWGADYDLAAAAFEELLLERGAGKLEHPAYGSVDVVPFGQIKRRDDLKTAANQAVLEVTFWETIGVIYPLAQTDPGSSVLQATQAYNAASAQQTADSLSLDSAVERVAFQNDYEALLDQAEDGLQAVAAAQDDVQQQFDTIRTSIDKGIDTLIADPLSLAAQTTLLVQAPARAEALISDRLDAYGDLLDSIVAGDGASVSEPNELYTREAFASAYVSGSVLSAVNNQFETKTEALDAASTILDQFDRLVTWRDDTYAALGVIDSGEAYQQLQEAVALAAGFLVFISFSLKQERRLTLDRDRTPIDLIAELYGTVDDRLDFFINSNALTGSEILEIPEGREIVYYI